MKTKEVPVTATGICSICREPYGSYGNNAWPVNDGRCCNTCNSHYVIPARIRNMRLIDKIAAKN